MLLGGIGIVGLHLVLCNNGNFSCVLKSSCIELERWGVGSTQGSCKNQWRPLQQLIIWRSTVAICRQPKNQRTEPACDRYSALNVGGCQVMSIVGADRHDFRWSGSLADVLMLPRVVADGDGGRRAQTHI